MIYYIGYTVKDCYGKTQYETTYAPNKAEAYECARNILLGGRRGFIDLVDSEVIVGKCHKGSYGYRPDEIIEVLMDRELTEEEKEVTNYREYHPVDYQAWTL